MSSDSTPSLTLSVCLRKAWKPLGNHEAAFYNAILLLSTVPLDPNGLNGNLASLIYRYLSIYLSISIFRSMAWVQISLLPWPFGEQSLRISVCCSMDRMAEIPLVHLLLLFASAQGMHSPHTSVPSIPQNCSHRFYTVLLCNVFLVIFKEEKKKEKGRQSQITSHVSTLK